MNKIGWWLFLFISAVEYGQAQNARFLKQGKIEFERKVNLYALSYLNTDEAGKKVYKDNVGQFRITYSDLLFKNGKTLYLPGRPNPENNKLAGQPAEDNIIFSELNKSLAVSQKRVYDKTYLIYDSIRSIQWKITGEKRNIAGFECKRANAVIMDSVYVVAFYTDEIIDPGGPESFSGLPGMILGIALPHEHITLFATKLYSVELNDTELAAPVKGEKVTNRLFEEKLREGFKGWSKSADWYIKAILL